MDLNFLYYLQNLREATPDWGVSAINTIADIPAGMVAVIIISIIYWCFSKKEGNIIIGSYLVSYFINGLLKVTACVYRPWIRDSRLHVAAIAEKGATGYSFPSGHATQAGSMYTSIAYSYGRKAKWLTPVCVILILFTMFARSFLGAHTPQDVFVGALTGVISVFIVVKLTRYINTGDRELNIVVLVTTAVTIMAVLYIVLKPYPMDMDAAGALLADPVKMVKDSVKGAGMLFGYVMGIFFDKKKVGFKDTTDNMIRVKRALIGIVCVLVLYLVFGALAKKIFGEIAGTFVEYMLVFMGVTGIVPFIFKTLKIDV